MHWYLAGLKVLKYSGPYSKKEITGILPVVPYGASRSHWVRMHKGFGKLPVMILHSSVWAARFSVNLRKEKSSFLLLSRRRFRMRPVSDFWLNARLPQNAAPSAAYIDLSDHSYA